MDRGGTGGVVPARVRQSIIDGAVNEMGETIAFADFEPTAGERYLTVSDPRPVSEDAQ